MGNELNESVVRLVMQLAVMLAAAKIAGELFERYLHQPSVLGELVVGMIIGPFALGSLPVPGLGPLFPLPSHAGGATVIPVSVELYSVAQIGAVVLLFFAGLSTDFGQFFRYGGPAAVVAVGGVVIPFALGAGATVALGFASGFVTPMALFVGAVMTATSVGITARVLSDIHRLDTPEGVTVLAGAVIDDVLGIIVLSVVVSLVGSGQISFGDLGLVGAKAIGFWIGLTGVGILLSRHIARSLGVFNAEGASLALGLALGFFCAVLAEKAGLAMIIGAYSIGLALSRTELAESLQRSLAGVYHALVPVFFVLMGMLVNFEAMRSALLFGVVISVLAIIGKLVGCGLPSLAVGFNKWGALRVGIGMMPRGEVALIIASIGLASGAVNQEIFGVSVMMTIVTTLVAPILLVPVFRTGAAGHRKAVEGQAEVVL